VAVLPGPPPRRLPVTGPAVTILISGGTVVTMDAEFRVIEDGAVGIEGDVITEIGKRADLDTKSRGAKKTIDALNRMRVRLEDITLASHGMKTSEHNCMVDNQSRDR